MNVELINWIADPTTSLALKLALYLGVGILLTIPAIAYLETGQPKDKNGTLNDLGAGAIMCALMWPLFVVIVAIKVLAWVLGTLCCLFSNPNSV